VGEITADVVKKLRDHSNRIERLEKVEYPKCSPLSSNPGETASALTTDQAGTLTLHQLTVTHLVKGATEIYGYVPLATPLTSTSWDGDSYTTADDEVLVDAVAVFGVPSGAKSIYVAGNIRNTTTADLRLSLGPSAGNYSLVTRNQVANIYQNFAGNINLDANTKFYFQVGGTLSITIQIWGYYI
jgi:hypothetical protein